MRRIDFFRNVLLMTVLWCMNLIPARSETSVSAFIDDAQYKVSVELPSLHIPFADKQQVVEIKVDDLKDEIEAQEAGAFDKIFTNFTDAAFFKEDGGQLVVPNMKVLLKKSGNGTVIQVKVPANTEIKRDVYYLGKMNGDFKMEDLRTQGYEIYLTVSAGNTDLLPYVNIESGKKDTQTINIEMSGFEEALGEFYSSVFMDGTKYFLVAEDVENDPNNPKPAESIKLNGVSLFYTDAEGLVLTAGPDLKIEPGKYFIVWDMDTEYIDFRWYNVEKAYINITSDVTECIVRDIIIDSYTAYTDIVQEGLAAELKEKIGEGLFSKIFTPTRNISYCFVDVETGEMYPLFLIYPDNEFVVQVSEENVEIDNKKVYWALFDWNTEKPIDIDVKIYNNLIVKTAREIIDGELPSVSVESSNEDKTVEISTENIRAGWDFINPEYWPAVFTDGLSYRLVTDDKADLGLKLVYSEEREVLELTVPANSVLEKGIYYLADSEGRDLRDFGYTVSIELEINQGTSIAENHISVPVVKGVCGGIVVDAGSSAVTVYDLCGNVVSETFVDGEHIIAAAAGIYLVNIADKTYKVAVE